MSNTPMRFIHSYQKTIRAVYIAFAAVFATPLLITQQAFAQQKDAPATSPAPLPQDLFLRPINPGRKRQILMRLHHVIPSQMVSWLQPTNQSVPEGTVRPSIQPGYQLPVGIDRIVAIDPQNALLVFGTEEAIKELEKLVAILDKPQRQVEIASQLWHVKNSVLPPALLKLAASSRSKTAAFAIVADEVELALRKSVGIRGSQLLTAPRISIGENLFHSWQYNVHSIEAEANDPLTMPNVWEKHKPGFYSDMPVVKLPDVDSSFSMPNVRRKWEPSPLAGTSVSLQIASTLNDNGTIELSITGQSVAGVGHSILLNGETLAIYLPQVEKLDRDSKTFLLLKPRIVRPSEMPNSTP